MKSNNIIMGVLVAVIAVMGVAFAAFSTSLSITGTAAISSNWKIEIAPGSCTAESHDAGNRVSSATVETNGAGKVKVVADFATPGDTVTCTAIVTNKSTGLSATRVGWELISGISNADAYDVELSADEAKELLPNDSETLTVKVTYKQSVTAAPAGEATFTAQALYQQPGV